MRSLTIWAVAALEGSTTAIWPKRGLVPWWSMLMTNPSTGTPTTLEGSALSSATRVAPGGSFSTGSEYSSSLGRKRRKRGGSATQRASLPRALRAR
jgi:hypothetical protein